MSYPDVPDVSGVPTIPRDPNDPISQPALLSSDSVTVTGYSNLPKWGLLKDGQSVIDADNIVNFEYKKDWTIADYQVEEGSFASYDKVELPYDARMTFSKGGSESDRADFITQVEAVVASLDLYEIVTPETSYANANAAHYDYRRTNTDGVGLIKANIYFIEIRVTSAENFSTTNTSPASQTDVQDPGASAQVNNGVAQPAPLATLQAPVSASSSGATGIAGDSAAVTPATSTSLSSIAATQNVPIETPANQANGPHFDATPRLANGVEANPPSTVTGVATATTYTLDPVSGGTFANSPITGMRSLIPPGQAPQSTGVQ